MDLHEVQEAIEHAATTADPSERRAKLRVYREVIDGLRGLCDSYLADDHLMREAEALVLQAREAVARENATLREEMVRRGMATDEAMDTDGMLSHADLDHLQEEGLLDAALNELYPLVEVDTWTDEDERKHPRGRGGRWGKGFGHTFAKPKRPIARGRTGPLTHPHPKGKPAPKPAPLQYAAGPEGTVRPGTFGAAEKERPKGQSQTNRQRVAALAERTARRVKLATSGRRLTAAEAIFNAAGSVSQHTLLQFVRDAASKPDSMSQHSKPGADGKPIWNSERKALHEAIIDALLRRPDIINGELHMNPDNPYLEPDPDGQPKALFSGGGYAAGKGGSIKLLRAEGREPVNALTLDPDRIKAMLPEYMDALDADDPEGNLLVYREAWEIAQEVQRRAQEKKLNIIVDGVSNTTVEEIASRVDGFHAAGYVDKDGKSTVQIVYTDIETDDALNRMSGRFQNAAADSDRRHIPELIGRAVHRDVAATIPALLDYLAKLDPKKPAPRIEVFDNNQGKDPETGKFRPPKRFAYFDPETHSVTIEDNDRWNRLKQKGKELIPGVDTGSSGTEPQAADTASSAKVTPEQTPSTASSGTTIGATWALSSGPEANYSPSASYGAAVTDLQRSEHMKFRDSISTLAQEMGVEVQDVSDTVGYYRYSTGDAPEFEPALSLQVTTGEGTMTLAAEIGRRMKQDSVMHFDADPEGPDTMFTVKGIHGTPDEVLARATELGIVGASVTGDEMHFAAHNDEALNVSQAMKTLYDEGRFKGGQTSRPGHLRFVVRNNSAKWRSDQETYSDVLAGSKESKPAAEGGADADAGAAGGEPAG